MENPDLNSEKLAEFVGIMLGDGCIGKYRCRSDGGEKIQTQVKITLHREERMYAKYVEGLFDDLFGFVPPTYEKKSENIVEVRSFRRKLFEFLTEELGLKESPKWGKATIPEPCLKNPESVLRGYFDTDGSVVLTDNNGTLYPRLEMKICPSPMRDQMEKILGDCGFNFGWYEIGKGKVRVQMNGESQLEKWLDEIGIANSKHKDKIECLGLQELV